MQESRMGGIEYNAIALAKELDKGKFDIFFLCPAEGKLTEKCRYLNIPYSIIKLPKFYSTSLVLGEKFLLLNPFAIMYNFIVFLFSAIRCEKLIKKNKFDIICTKGLLSNFYGSLAALLAKTKCLWDMQDVVDGNRVFGLLRCVVNLWGFFLADYIIAGSQAIAGQFYKFLGKKVIIIYNGITLKEFNPETADAFKIRREFNIKDEDIIIGHIARFTYWKGQLDFIRAAGIIHNDYPKAKFFLVGGPVFETQRYSELIMSEIRKLRLEEAMIIPGFREDLPDILACFDIFVHSSIEPEGCPLTVIYAMAMAKAIVATAVPGTNELVCDDCGILVPPSCPQEIAQALRKFIDDKTLRLSMGRFARQKAQKMFSLERYSLESERTFLKLTNA